MFYLISQMLRSIICFIVALFIVIQQTMYPKCDKAVQETFYNNILMYILASPVQFILLVYIFHEIRLDNG